jgi:hypothetical protein
MRQNKLLIRGRIIAAICAMSMVAVLVLVVEIAASLEVGGEKGLVTFVEGSAKKQKMQETEWANVYKDAEVIGGDRLRTMTQSRAELELARIDKIRMAPKTTIDIFKLYEETKEQARESKIVLQNGDLWANVGKKSENMKFTIGTPVAAAAITGTTLRLNVAQDSSAEVKVYHGEVILTNAPESKTVIPKSLQPYQVQAPYEIPGPREVTMEEWAIIVKSMQKVKVDKNGKITSAGKFALGDTDEQSDWVKWNMEMDKMAK